jgi:hypothetical protein
MFRPSGPLPPRGPNTGIRRSHIMQRAAGKMFYQWAEVLGQRLEEIINEDKHLEPHIAAMVLDEQKQKELLMQDEEEDFLDEGWFKFVTNHFLKFIFSEYKHLWIELFDGSSPDRLYLAARNHIVPSGDLPDATKVFADDGKGASAPVGAFIQSRS